MATRKQTTRIDRTKRQDYIIIWVDAHINTVDEDTQNTKTKLKKAVNEVQLITEPEQCIRLVQEFNGTRSFVITSGAFGQNLVPKIHDINSLEAIFVFCGNKIYHQEWSQQWSKIRGVETDIDPICQALAKLVKQVKQDEIAMSFIPAGNSGPGGDFQQLDPSFMYSSLLKETLLTMKFTSEHIQRMVNTFLEKYQDDPNEMEIIREFQGTYQSKKAIWWYTREGFTYNEVNSALRHLEGDVIVEMGFFIHDLHKRIEKLHKKQLPSFGINKFILYRGQGLSKESLEEAKNCTGGLLGFNCFLSTSTDKSISLGFAESGSQRAGHCGLLFVMNIDPSLEMIPFARIAEHSAMPSENEILFAMHTIFKIGAVKPLSGRTNIYQITLELTGEDDVKLQGLQHYMSGKYTGCSEHRLGRILFDMGNYDKAGEIYSDLIQKAKNDRDKGLYIHHLGFVHERQGQYEKALENYTKALDIRRKVLPQNHPDIAETYHRIGAVYYSMGEYSKALEYYEKSLEMRKKTLPEYHPDIAATYGNIGGVYYSMGEYSKALQYYENSLEMRKKTLPKDHPDIAASYNNIGLVYDNMREYSKALEYSEQSLEMSKKTLPKDHPDIAASYNNIGLVYDNMGEYSKALQYYEQSLEMRKKTLPKDHPDIAKSYWNIGCVYYARKHYPKALEYLEEARRIYMKSLPPKHPKIKKVNDRIAKVKAKM